MGHIRTYIKAFQRFLKDRHGASILEMTVMLPFLVALAFGVIEFGRALQHYHTINKSMRDAARFLARVQIDCVAPPSTACSFADANNITRAKNLAMTGYVSGGTPILNYWNDPDSITIILTPYNNTLLEFREVRQANIPRIRVTAKVPFQDLGMLAVLGLSSMTFNVRHDELSIGE